MNQALYAHMNNKRKMKKKKKKWIQETSFHCLLTGYPLSLCPSLSTLAASRSGLKTHHTFCNQSYLLQVYIGSNYASVENPTGNSC
jgi:hypothetical protein